MFRHCFAASGEFFVNFVRIENCSRDVRGWVRDLVDMWVYYRLPLTRDERLRYTALPVVWRSFSHDVSTQDSLGISGILLKYIAGQRRQQERRISEEKPREENLARMGMRSIPSMRMSLVLPTARSLLLVRISRLHYLQLESILWMCASRSFDRSEDIYHWNLIFAVWNFRDTRDSYSCLVISRFPAKIFQGSKVPWGRIVLYSIYLYILGNWLHCVKYHELLGFGFLLCLNRQIYIAVTMPKDSSFIAKYFWFFRNFSKV